MLGLKDDRYKSPQQGNILAIAALILGLIALGLGLYEVLIEQTGGDVWYLKILPAGVIALGAVGYLVRNRTSADADD
ncbi:MAG: hypothetical protein AAF399_08040 [Bacteroidota bacterium]